MKPQSAHTYEERLLDFVYGELSPSEARQVEEHVQECARCTEALDGIRGVRSTMSRLPLESAPDAGLDSLLAYAQQSARRAAAGPAPVSRWWRRWLVPVVSAAAVSVFGVVVLRVDSQVDLSPNLDQVKAPKEEAVRQAPPASAPETAAEAEAAYAEPVAVAASEPSSAKALHNQFDEVVRKEEQRRAEPAPSRMPPRTALRERSSSRALEGSGGGFPEKKRKTRASVADSLGADLDDAELEQSQELVMAEKPAYEPSAPAPAAAPAPPAPPAQQAAPAELPSSLALRGGSASGKGFAEEFGSTSKSNAGGGRLSLGSGAAKKESRSKSVRRPSAVELSRQAEDALREGNRSLEAGLLRAALSAGASGALRVDLLSRLCAAESALGRRQSTLDTCRRVMKEAPGSREALAAQRLLESELRSAPAEADAVPAE